MLRILKKIIPKSVFEFFQPIYHYGWAVLGALIYRFPSRKLVVVGVTGTKGKTTVVELVNTILKEAGFKTATASTLHFKIGDKERRNLFKMTMPGRFFMQKFLRDAVRAECTHAVIEVTSEGAKQFRHKFIYLDALIFTNLAPEHIESHGSYENYVKAKLSIAKGLEKPSRKVWPNEALRRMTQGGSEETRGLFEKTFPVLIVNTNDKEAEKFLTLNIKNKIPYSLNDAAGIKADEKGCSFQIEKFVFHSKLPGIFNVSNILGAIACTQHFGISLETIKKGVENLEFVRGRMEKIKEGQNFDLVVDYAHTPDSLGAVYEAYQKQKYHLICVLGNTGGGRDTWKRKVMGGIADEYCSQIILANEDPYDEDPMKILEDIKKGINKKPCEIIMDRREAIQNAIQKALVLQENQGDKYKIAVLITGKGTDPYIMGTHGTKQEWDDATVAREELQKILKK